MIILFEENETEFTSLGLGVLKDAIECKVKESLNDSFALSMKYPIIGLNYDKIKVDRIIYCKANPFDTYQPFRIYSITKPINGTITVEANHISYDTNGLPVKAISGNNLNDIFDKLKKGEDIKKDDEITHVDYCLLENPFTFSTDIFSSRSFKTTAPYNLRAILMGGEESLVERYEGELKFDKFLITILSHRGRNRGATVKYGKNMTDLNHETTAELLYNGVYPYYHTERSSKESSTSGEFKKVYIVGTKPFQSDWLSYTKDGEPYIPLSTEPVQIATEGDYLDKIYCWNADYQKYEEKIYNEQVTVIQGIFEPSWIRIDWSKFPTVSCRANRKGYFKTSTDGEWGEIKGVGDVIFEGSIISSGLMQNLIVYFSEVIPSNEMSETEEVSEIIDVQLDDPIIWLKTPDATSMKHNNILPLDLTSEFDEEPSKENLRTKAEEFISKNKLGTVRHSTTVSFIDLFSTTEKDKYTNFDHVELGDEVRVIYQDLGVDVELRVISYTYNVIADIYEEVELGEKKNELSSTSVQTGDNISSLVNDMSYADVTTVNKLIADTVTANYIQAANSKLTQAQIKQLEVERIDCKGIIEASQFTLDTLVANLLIADNAKIAQTLEAGEIKVSGDINVKSGSITIESSSIEGVTSFVVDEYGNMTANSVEITGGEFNINDGVFLVQNDGTMYAKNAHIEGLIEAIDGHIGGFIISEDMLHSEDYDPNTPSSGVCLSPEFIKVGNNFAIYDDGEVEIKSGSIKLGYDEETGEYAFSVDETGEITVKSGSINLGYDSSTGEYNMSLDDDGNLDAKSANIRGKIGPLEATETKLSYNVEGTEYLSIDPTIEEYDPESPKSSMYANTMVSDAYFTKQVKYEHQIQDPTLITRPANEYYWTTLSEDGLVCHHSQYSINPKKPGAPWELMYTNTNSVIELRELKDIPIVKADSDATDWAQGDRTALKITNKLLTITGYDIKYGVDNKTIEIDGSEYGYEKINSVNASLCVDWDDSDVLHNLSTAVSKILVYWKNNTIRLTLVDFPNMSGTPDETLKNIWAKVNLVIIGR